MDAAFSAIGYAVTIIQSLYDSTKAVRENAVHLLSLKRRIERVRVSLNAFCKDSPTSHIYHDITKRIREDFDAIGTQLDEISKKVQEDKRVKTFLRAIDVSRDLPEILVRLGALEKHLDSYGLMLDLRTAVQYQGGLLHDIYQLLLKLLPLHDAESASDADDGNISQLPIAPSEAADNGVEKAEAAQVRLIESLAQKKLQVGESSITAQDTSVIVEKIQQYEDNWKLSLSDIHFEKGLHGRWKVLGKGGFSTVYKAHLQLRDEHSGLEAAKVSVAVKELDVDETQLEQYKPHFLREIHAQIDYAHPCILRTYGGIWPAQEAGPSDGSLSDEEHSPMIVTERMTCDLSKGISHPALASMKTRTSIALDIASAVSHLHSKGVVHRDVKPENVLLRIIDNEIVSRAKLSDFGVSRKVTTTRQIKTYATKGSASGTIMYMPPEVLLDLWNCPSRRSWDVWSFGLVLCVLGGQREGLGLQINLMNAAEFSRTGRLAEAAMRWAESIADERLKKAAVSCLKGDWRERARIEEVVQILLGKDVEMPDDHQIAGLLLDQHWTSLSFPPNMPKWNTCFSQLGRICENNGCRGQDFERGLQLLRDAARESRGFLTQNPNELAFQMHSRLVDKVGASWVVKRYLEALSNCCAKPWLRPLTRCHNSPGGVLARTIPMRSAVDSISVVNRSGHVVVAAGKTILLVEVETCAVLREYVGHNEIVNSVVLSSGNQLRIVSGGDDRTVRVWDMETGKALGEPLRGHSDCVKCVAVFPDGRRIVSGGNEKTVRVWDMETGKAMGEPLSGHSNWVKCVAVSPDGRRIVSGGDDMTVRVWDTETGKAVGMPLCGHSSSVSCMVISPDGRWIVSGGNDRTVRVWEMATCKAVGKALRGHSGCVNCVAFSPDGRQIASGGDDMTVRVVDMATGQAVRKPLCGHSSSVSCIVISPDGRWIMSGGDDRTVRVWNMETVKERGKPLRGHSGLVNSTAISPDGRQILSGGSDRNVRMWDMETGMAAGKLLGGHLGWVKCAAISPDCRQIVSGGKDRNVRVWDMETGKAMGKPLRGHWGEVKCVAISPDGRRIVSGGKDWNVRVWDMETGKAMGKPLRGHWGWVKCVAVSPDGRRIVSGGDDGTVRVWDMEIGKAKGEPLRGHSGSVWSVAVSPDGRRIASGGNDCTVRVWDMESGKAVGDPLRGHSDKVLCVAISPDGGWIVSGGVDRTVRMWDMETGQEMGEPLRGLSGWIRSVAVSPDGRRIVAGREDLIVRVWDVETGKAVGEPLGGHSTYVFDVKFIAGGIVRTTCGKKTLYWKMDAESGHMESINELMAKKIAEESVGGIDSGSRSTDASGLQVSLNNDSVRLTRGGPVAATLPGTWLHHFDEAHRILVTRYRSGYLFWFKVEV